MNGKPGVGINLNRQAGGRIDLNGKPGVGINLNRQAGGRIDLNRKTRIGINSLRIAGIEVRLSLLEPGIIERLLGLFLLFFRLWCDEFRQQFV